MPSSGLLGPYPLDEAHIEQYIAQAEDWSSASAFALGPLKDGRFFIRRVGHGDGDLGAILKTYIGQYEGFKFKFFRSTRSAYDKECRLYHDFNPKDNEDHPVKPKNTKFTCPVPSCIHAE
jgi:hypothetical protein